MSISADLLPVVLEFMPIAALFAARLTCKYVQEHTRKLYAKYAANEIVEGGGKTVFGFLAAKNKWFPRSPGAKFRICEINEINLCWHSIKTRSYLVTIKTNIPCELTGSEFGSVIAAINETACFYLRYSQDVFYHGLEFEPVMDVRVNNIDEPKEVFSRMLCVDEFKREHVNAKLLNVIEITGGVVEEKSLFKRYRKMCGGTGKNKTCA